MIYLKLINKKGILIGKNPTSIVGAIIYIAAIVNRERKTHKQISEVVGVSGSTIRGLCRIINSNNVI